ncbi:MAG: PRC-barrel domain-containing protein [Planctomycetales bacterium]|nr:PRC-barrel domain-containing protein [Planctomycetales bacterium]
MNKLTTGMTLLSCVAVAGLVNGQDASTRAPRTERSQASRLDTVTAGANVRASQLMGMNIQNSAGEGLGEINDLVLDANTGKVKYAAVTYGGFLGIGNKMFAVPFAAFKVKSDPDDRSDVVLMLDVTQKQMEGAVGFDEEHWPDFADKKFQIELDKRYGVGRDRSVRVDVDRDGINVDVIRERE